MSKQNEQESRTQVGQLGPLDREAVLANRLRRYGVDLFAGVSDVNSRRERARQAIFEHGLSEVIAGVGRDGKSRTYAEVFEVIYGEPLVPQSAGRKVQSPPARSQTRSATGEHS